jgi:PAS domain S-box-containing protein
MTAITLPAFSPPAPTAEKAITLALRLAHAENALHALAAGQVDAIIDPDGKAYLLRPAQEHLRENENRLRTTIDSSADVITVVDRSGVILSQSQAVRRVLGYEPEELVGRSIFELIYESDLDQLYSAFFHVIEGFQENATAQFHHPTRDGSFRLVEATVAKLSTASPARVVLSLRPIPSPRPAHPERAMSHALTRPEAAENHDSIIPSHGQRIPLTQPRFGFDGNDSAPI